MVQEAYGPKDSLIDTIRKNLGKSYPARSHEHVHASDLTKPNFCPREVALLDATKGQRKPEYIDTALKATFDVGNAVSDLVREQWLGAAAVGNWGCRKCGSIYLFTKKPPHCNCGESDFKYGEVEFISKTYGFTGSIDVLADLGAPLLYPVELKIISPTEFEKLEGPLAEHRIRTQLYLKLIADSDHLGRDKVNQNVAKVMYVSRAYGKKHPKYQEILPFKEFDVKRDDSSISVPLQRAAQVKAWRDHKVMPPQICPTSSSPVAKKCSVCAACFSGKFPATPLQNQINPVKTPGTL